MAKAKPICPRCMAEADELVDGSCAKCSGPWKVSTSRAKIGNLTGVGDISDRWPNKVDDDELEWLLRQADCWINYGESMMPERVLSLDAHCAATGMDPVEASWLVVRQAAARWLWRQMRFAAEEQNRIADLEATFREPGEQG